MFDQIMTLLDYFTRGRLHDDDIFYEESAQYLAKEVIDLEAEEVIGAKMYEWTDTRTN